MKIPKIVFDGVQGLDKELIILAHTDRNNKEDIAEEKGEGNLGPKICFAPLPRSRVFCVPH